MATKRWTRVGKGAGPANVLDDRWEVVRLTSRWAVIDRRTGQATRVGLRTMAQARVRAEMDADAGGRS